MTDPMIRFNYSRERVNDFLERMNADPTQPSVDVAEAVDRVEKLADYLASISRSLITHWIYDIVTGDEDWMRQFMNKARDITSGHLANRVGSWSYLPLDKCVAGNAYELKSRNLIVGVFDGDTGFIGPREKFDSIYLFTEFHYDTGAPFGTAHPIADLGFCPIDPIAERINRTDEKPIGDENRPLLEWLQAFEPALVAKREAQMDADMARMKRLDDIEDAQ